MSALNLKMNSKGMLDNSKGYKVIKKQKVSDMCKGACSGDFYSIQLPCHDKH